MSSGLSFQQSVPSNHQAYSEIDSIANEFLPVPPENSIPVAYRTSGATARTVYSSGMRGGVP